MRPTELRQRFLNGLPEARPTSGLLCCLVVIGLTFGAEVYAMSEALGLAPNHTQENRTADALSKLSTDAEESSDWAAAEDDLLRAQHALHREHGVTTPKQGPVVERLAGLSVRTKNYQRANQLFEFNHFISQKTTDPTQAVLADITLARWYLQSGQYSRAEQLLKPFEADDFDGVDFVPERALLRLNIARFTQQCCSTKEILATAQQAKNAEIPQDLLQQFMEAAAQLLILADHRSDAEPLLQAASQTQYTPPVMIPGKRRIVYRDANRDISQMERMKIEQQLRMRGLSTDPYQYEHLWSSGPSTVTISASDQFLPIEKSDHREVGSQNQFHTLTGHPLRFRTKDLQHALPAKYRRREALKDLEVAMVFTITKEGRIQHIKFEGRYDRQVRELMREVLKTVRFQPERKDGVAVARENFRLVQTFYPMSEA